MANQHHVVHNPNGGWDVKKNNAERASLHTETKYEAEKLGRELSKKQGTEFVIHNLNGKISKKNSHGNDPYPPKG